MTHSIKYIMDNQEINEINPKIKLEYLFGRMDLLDKISIETQINNLSDEERIKEKKELKRLINNRLKIQIEVLNSSKELAGDEISEQEIKDKIFEKSMLHEKMLDEVIFDEIERKPKCWHCNECNHDYPIRYKSKHITTRKHRDNIA